MEGNTEALNSFLTSKDHMIYFLSHSRGLYLPESKSAVMTDNYLEKIFKKTVFSIKRDDIRLGLLKQTKSKAELFDILKKLVTDNFKMELGFDEETLPEKEWLINVIHSLDKANIIFRAPEDIGSAITISEE